MTKAECQMRGREKEENVLNPTIRQAH